MVENELDIEFNEAIKELETDFNCRQEKRESERCVMYEEAKS